MNRSKEPTFSLCERSTVLRAIRERRVSKWHAVMLLQLDRELTEEEYMTIEILWCT